jgi:hypothetical protein
VGTIHRVKAVVLIAAGLALQSFAQEEQDASKKSISPDGKWEFVDGDQPKIVKASTNEVALDLEGFGGVLWAPDSKRFACYSGGGGRWHTTSLYQLRGDEWKELKSPSPEDEVLAVAENAIAAQVKKKGLPKKTDLRLIWGTLETRQWVDSNTAILYAGLEKAVRENLDEAFGAHFLVTLKFDEAGNWKIVKTHRMSEKEVDKFLKDGSFCPHPPTLRQS